MKTKFTLEHLFLYHYNELSLSDTLAIEMLIESNETFREESRKIVEMQNFLNSGIKKPSASSIQIIMDYDKASSGEMAF